MHEILEDMAIAGYHRGCGQPVRERYTAEWLDVRGERCERRDYYLSCDLCGDVDDDELLAADDACEVCSAAPTFAGFNTCREHTDPVLVTCEERGLDPVVVGYRAERNSLGTWREVGRFADMAAAQAAIAGAGSLGRVRAIWAMPIEVDERKTTARVGGQRASEADANAHHNRSTTTPQTTTCFACRRPARTASDRFCWNCGAHIRGELPTRHATTLATTGAGLATHDEKLARRLAARIPDSVVEPVGAGWRVRL